MELHKEKYESPMGFTKIGLYLLEEDFVALTNQRDLIKAAFPAHYNFVEIKELLDAIIAEGEE